MQKWTEFIPFLVPNHVCLSIYNDEVKMSPKEFFVCLSIYNNEVKMSPKEFLLYQTP